MTGSDSPDVDTEDLHVRPAEQADILSVYRIERATFPQPWPMSAFEQFLGEPGFLVAVYDHDVFGYVVADVMPNFGRDIGHVKDLAVHPSFRGRGLGRRLLDEALVSMALDGAALVKLEVRVSNEPALELYRDVGFEPLRRVPRYYEDGEDALVMVLDVPEWQNARSHPDDASG